MSKARETHQRRPTFTFAAACAVMAGEAQRSLTAAAAYAASHLAKLWPAFGVRRASKLRLEPLAWRSMRAANQRRIRDRCMAIRVMDDVAVCRVLGRYKMYVEASDYGHAIHLMFDGYWEMHVTEVVAALVRPGMVAVDVGANQGYYTLLLAGLVEREGRVHAVEPNGAMAALLRRSIAANGLAGRVHIHPVPLGANDHERVVLRVPRGMPSGAYIETAGDDANALVTATLDGLLGEEPVDFIKIDAEGAELAIWAGMRGILARGAPLTVIIEFIVDRAPDGAAFLDEVRQHGFTLSHIHQSRGLLRIEASQILAAPTDQEWMLVLQRHRLPRQQAWKA